MTPGRYTMPLRCFRASLALLLFACISSAQTDRAATAAKQNAAGAPQQKESPKDNPADALGSLLGAPPIDKESAERGRKIFVPTCGFCHGNDAHGKSGPDLVRSPLALHDDKGDLIGPVIRNGRTQRGMPAFANLTAEQIADISMFLQSRAAAATNRFAYKIGDLATGDPQKGAAFFNGAGHCTECHSVTGDLAHVAAKYEPVDLQRRMLYPASNSIDRLLGKASAPPPPAKVTVKLPSGEQFSGTLDHLDEFRVSLLDASGWYHSFSRDNVTVEVHDPRAAHETLLPTYTDEQMHNLLAFLETLK